MWVALGITLTVMMFLCAYGAIAILSTTARIMKGSLMRVTIKSLQAEVEALRTQLAAKDAEIARLQTSTGKAQRRANHAEAAPREPQPITAAKLELKGETITATVKRGGATQVLASTHQKYVAGLVARILAAGCPADAIVRVGF